MENFLLNFAAQIDVSRINISSSVRNTLSALTKAGAGGGTSKVKQIVELDVRTVGNVSDIGSKIVDDLQKAISKVKVAPTAILGQKELGNVTGRLDQIPVLLKVIKAQIAAIQAKPELIPNAADNLMKLTNLSRSLREIRSAADKAFKLQFSAELAPLRVLDNQISSAANRVKDLQGQLDKLRASPGSAASEVAAQTAKMAEAKAKLDALRSDRKKAKSLSVDEVNALKAQEKEALDKFSKAQEARRKAKPITTQIDELSKKEKDLKKPIFSAQTAVTEKQRAAQAEIEAANKKLEAERQGLELLKKQTAEIAAQQALSTKTAQKKLAPLEKATIESETQKTAAGARLQSIEDRQRQIIAKEQAAAKKFLEGEFAKAEAEFKAKSAGIRSIKKREELKQQILGPLEDRKLAAETALNFSGFQPKGAEFAKLQKEKEAAGKAFLEAGAQQTAAQKALDAAKEEIIAKSKSKAASKELESQQKKVEEAAQKVLEIEKRTAAEVAKLKGEYDALTAALSKAQQKRADLEKQKKAGKTGLESFDTRVADAKKAVDEIGSRLLLAGEDPKKSRAFTQAREELRAAVQKRNEALQQQRGLDQEILQIETKISAQQKLQNDLEAQRNALAASMSGNLKQDLDLRKKIQETVDRTVAAEVRLDKKSAEAFAKSGRKYTPADTRSPRERALGRLGVTEAELSGTPSQELLQKVTSGAKTARDKRIESLEASKFAADRALQTDKAIENIKRLILRDLEIARRRSAITGGPAPTLGGSVTKILASTVGGGATSLDQARAVLTSADQADAVSAINRITQARTRQREELARLKNDEKTAASEAKAAAQAQAREIQTRSQAIERLNRLIERSALLYERQIRAANSLARSGIPGVQAQPVDQARLSAAARQNLLQGADPSTMSAAGVVGLERDARRRLRDQQANLREFNSAVRDVASGTRSAFELISRYSDSAFDRFGARVGLATERLAAYVTSGAGLYTIIAATRQAIIETALLEKEITGIQQIFDSLSTEKFASSVVNTFDLAAKKATNIKDLILELAQVTGQQPVELAQAAKTLAAAGFGATGKPGFEQTLRAVSFAGLGPSFGNSQEIIDGLIASVNQFNRSLEETPYILGLVNQFSKEYAVEAQDLFEAIKRGGGSFAAVGGNLEDFIKLVTVVREQTREAAPVIGTFLKTLSARLFSPRADKLLTSLGLDPQKLLDPYQRLLALAGEIEKKSGAGPAGNVKLLSEIIDVRQTGRLFSLLESLKDFDAKFKGENITEKAATSIVGDARKRLDDIGPTIDRIRVSYFKFVEGIYNNPATKALLDIPAGLLGILSEIPKAGFAVGKANFQASNFINPLAQGFAITGIAAVIRGSINALQQNVLSIRTNTASLDALRTSVNGLATRLGVQVPQVPGQAPGRGGFSGFISGVGARNIAAIGLATVIPGIVNSVLPATSLEQDTQNVISSGVQGGVSAALIANILGASARVVGVVGLVAGSLSALAADTENARKERQVRELEVQSQAARITAAFESRAESGLIGRQGETTNIPLASLSAQAFFDAIASAQSKGLEQIGNYTTKDFTNDLLGITKLSERNLKTESRQKTLELFAGNVDDFDPREAEKGFEAAGEKIRASLERIVIQRLRSLPDTVETRKKVIADVSREFANEVTVGGVKLDQESIRKSLQGFLEIDQETKNLATTFGSFKLSIKTLYEESEIAARTINVLGATLARVTETQNIGIQRVLDQAKRNLPSVDTTRKLLTNPFTVQTAQPLAQSATVNTALATIRSLGQQTPQNILSPEVLKLSNIIDGFLNELSVADASTREKIVRAFSDESLKSIGGLNQEIADSGEESRQSLQGLAVSNQALAQQIESAFEDLLGLGASSKELFDLIKTSAPFGSQPFDLRELAKAITSGETGAGTKIVGLQQAEQRIREQANLIIERQNLTIQQQVQATEALISTLIERRNAELELSRANRDNQLSILAFQSTLGFVSKEFAAQFGTAIKETERRSRGTGEDITGISDTINLIKRAQNELNRYIQSIGSQGGPNTKALNEVPALIRALNPGLKAFGLREISDNASTARTAADLAGSRALLERYIQEVFANLQDKFRNLGETIESIGTKIQAQRGAIEGIINKLFSGTASEQAIARASLQTAQFNVQKISAAIKGIDPALLDPKTGPNALLDQRVADAIAPIISSISQRDLAGLREYLNLAGPNALAAGGTGEQIKAAIDAAFAKILPTFGINVGLQDIQQNISAGQTAIQQALDTARQLREAGVEQARILGDNVNLVTKEVSNLSAAIAGIPKQIDLVIKGINNVTVDFDITNVQKSINTVGQQVYSQVLRTLTEAFRRANISVPELGG